MTATGVEALARALDLLLASDGFAAATVHLFTNNFVPQANSVIADFTEANYTGYVAQNLGATGTAMLNPEGDVVLNFPHLTFTPTGTAVGNVVYGAWCQGTVEGTGERLIWAVQFDSPQSLTSPLTSLVYEPRFPLGQPKGN